MKKNKPCKRCKGKGYEFIKDDNIDTGKVNRYFGFDMPVFTSGRTQTTCSSCYGKGVK